LFSDNRVGPTLALINQLLRTYSRSLRSSGLFESDDTDKNVSRSVKALSISFDGDIFLSYLRT